MLDIYKSSMACKIDINLYNINKALFKLLSQHYMQIFETFLGNTKLR